MNTLVADIIRLTHAATNLSQYQGTEQALAYVTGLADWLEMEVQARENYFFGRFANLPPPQNPHFILTSQALGPLSIPATPQPRDLWPQESVGQLPETTTATDLGGGGGTSSRP